MEWKRGMSSPIPYPEGQGKAYTGRLNGVSIQTEESKRINSYNYNRHRIITKNIYVRCCKKDWPNSKPSCQRRSTFPLVALVRVGPTNLDCEPHKILLTCNHSESCTEEILAGHKVGCLAMWSLQVIMRLHQMCDQGVLMYGAEVRQLRLLCCSIVSAGLLRRPKAEAIILRCKVSSLLR